MSRLSTALQDAGSQFANTLSPELVNYGRRKRLEQFLKEQDERQKRHGLYGELARNQQEFVEQDVGLPLAQQLTPEQQKESKLIGLMQKLKLTGNPLVNAAESGTMKNPLIEQLGMGESPGSAANAEAEKALATQREKAGNLSDVKGKELVRLTDAKIKDLNRRRTQAAAKGGKDQRLDALKLLEKGLTNDLINLQIAHDTQKQAGTATDEVTYMQQRQRLKGSLNAIRSDIAKIAQVETNVFKQEAQRKEKAQNKINTEAGRLFRQDPMDSALNIKQRYLNGDFGEPGSDVAINKMKNLLRGLLK